MDASVRRVWIDHTVIEVLERVCTLIWKYDLKYINDVKNDGHLFTSESLFYLTWMLIPKRCLFLMQSD